MNDTLSAAEPLALRYQRLVLLNRITVALFGDRPFTAAVSEAGHAALALMGAQSIAVYEAAGDAPPSLAYRHADKRLGDEAAQDAERALLARALEEKRIVVSGDGTRGWEAAPLMRLTAEKAVMTGCVVFGRLKAEPLDAEREGSLVEIARHLRNAWMIQDTLRRRAVAAAVLDQSSEAIFVTDLEHVVTAWNAGAEDLLGWTAAQAIGRHGKFLVPDDKTAQIEAVIAEVMEKGRMRSVETERLRADGSRIAVEGTFTLLKDEDGRPFAIVRFYRDITRRKEVERLKSEFTALVSHELRTPLTAIKGFAETIRDFGDELDADKKREYLQIMADEATRLGHMVGDFLDIARIESGGIDMRLETVDVGALFARVAALFKENKGGIRFAFDLKPGASSLRGDPEQLYRLLVNLGGNALKYTPQGGLITLSAAPRDGDVEIGVLDQGPGVAKRDQARLFEKFYRAGDPITRKTPGTGLGLAICKGIVEAHGGSIRVENEPGAGAKFVARLPKDGPPPA